MANLAEELKNKNVPVGGIGVQSHLKVFPMYEEALEVSHCCLVTMIVNFVIVLRRQHSNVFETKEETFLKPSYI